MFRNPIDKNAYDAATTKPVYDEWVQYDGMEVELDWHYTWTAVNDAIVGSTLKTKTTV